ncbi:MAG: 50S ribosomal protein L23 [Candidatus Kaiserbacteria bacterium]|nr:MAG: 50S ribosomal protein L23 [Candidatus Kaiserbacteria bacterium]
MALFSRKKTAAPAKAADTEEKKVARAENAPQTGSGARTAHVLKNPRITEKATAHSAEGIYTFDVADEATKRQILQAVAAVYGVHPKYVRIAQVPQKIRKSMRTGKRGIKKGGKKAYVYLKKGDTITIL